MKYKAVHLLIYLAVLLTACGSISAQTTSDFTPITSTVSPSPSLTVVWFPPTRTPTPPNIVLPPPTPEQRPGIGEILQKDTFATQQGWQTIRNETGSVAYGKNEITIAISQPKGSLNSLYEIPLPENFYLEIDTSPSLCRGDDTYGVLLRASSNRDYYQFAISCNGLLRLDRIKNGRLNAVIRDWTASGQVAPGSPLMLRLGIWVAGNETRFFINDVHQFTVHGLSTSGSQIGIFARSGGTTALTVNFSNLVIRTLQNTASSKTLQPTLRNSSTPVSSNTPLASFTPATPLPRPSCACSKRTPTPHN